MSGFVRHRNSKRLSYREGGRFAKVPSLEALGVVKICACNAFIVREAGEQVGGRFVSPEAARGAWPKTCDRCGAKVSR